MISRETRNFSSRSTLTGLTEKEIVPHKIIIFQPSIKLKYRGITHYTKQVLIMNINNSKIIPNVTELNVREQPAKSNNINTTNQ